MMKKSKCDPSKWGIVKLKNFLEEMGLPTTGTKKEVLQRVLDNCDEDDLEYEA
jgi:hypothetical protein